MCGVVHCGIAAQAAAVGGAWIQGRYHSESGETVADVLSFRSVFDINPYETGRSHTAERRVYSARTRLVKDALALRPLMRRVFCSLSTGEMRRVLFARAVLTGAGRIVWDDPMDGLDSEWRKRIADLAAILGNEGMSVEFAAVSDASAGERPREDFDFSGNSCDYGDIAEKPPFTYGEGRRGGTAAREVVRMSGVSVSFGGRTLFRNLSWTVREGERWMLRGPNGSGKTTLLALISGDSPLAYAFDISVFGRRRGGPGVTLAESRARIGIVSAERCAYLGMDVRRQLDAALRRGTRLLILDEPCYGLAQAETAPFLDRVADWLDAHPRAAAVCVAHRSGQVPRGFDRDIDISRTVIRTAEGDLDGKAR